MQETLECLVEIFSEPDRDVWARVKEDLTPQERRRLRSLLATKIMVLKTAIMYLED
jgi:hypothetical protein